MTYLKNIIDNNKFNKIILAFLRLTTITTSIFNGIYYHPTFFYESIWCVLGFFVLLCVRHYKYLKVGGLTCVYLIWYSIGRFFIESMRTDSLMLGGFKVAQIVSFILFIIGILGLMIQSRKGKFEDLYSEPNHENIHF